VIGSVENSLTFSIYQPQIIRILKTLEIVGLFNEFNEGALASFNSRKLTTQEAEDYLIQYQEWHCICQDKKQEKRAKFLRDQMLVIEN